MSFNPNTISFLVKRLAESSLETFVGVSQQIFHYLRTEVKDNPVFDDYEKKLVPWRGWIDELGDDFQMPSRLEAGKELAYAVYDSLALKGYQHGLDLTFTMFSQSHLKDGLRRLNETFLPYFASALEDIIKANPERATEQPEPLKGKTVFIIHGHDNELKTELQLLLHRAGVREVVLHERPDKGRTIIDKLTQETEEAAYAVALLSPDDTTTEGDSRARQNVILEIGYLLGKIGKERIRLVVKGNVEIPSDLSGVLYEKHDPSGSWKVRLLKEMQAVGIYVDIQAALEKF